MDNIDNNPSQLGASTSEPFLRSTLTGPHRPVSVLVCRGCCCGNEQKLPGVDHDAHLDRLRVAVSSNPDSKLRTVDCLGPCQRANVVVVRRGQDRWWFGDLRADDRIDTLSRWLASPAGPPPAGCLIEAPHATNPRRLAPERGENMIDWLVGAIARGVWTMGVYGAVAEFHAERPTIRRDATVVTAVTTTGALRVEVDDRTRLFTFSREDAPDEPRVNLLARTGAGPKPAFVVTALGRDAHAVDPARRNDLLFDLGLGRTLAAFMIRTGNPELQRMLAGACGFPWTSMAPSLLAEITAASPTRVVSTGLGRTEVSSPISLPDGEAPHASRTHLSLGRLELGVEWPLGLDVPEGWTSGIAQSLDPV